MPEMLSIGTVPMPRKPEVDAMGKALILVAARFPCDIIEMIDLLSPNRSEFIRDATHEKIAKEMQDGQGSRSGRGAKASPKG